MFDKGHRSSPEHGAELVSYIYGEMDAPAREAFESHLQVCDECVFELSEFADARLGVIEWRRNDFERLANPAIVIPSLEPEVRVEKVGVFAAFLESLSSIRMIARAGFALATAAILIAVVYFSLAPRPSSTIEVANSTAQPEPQKFEAQVPPRESPNQVTTAEVEKTGEPQRAVHADEHSIPKRAVNPSRLMAERRSPASANVHKLGSEEARNTATSGPRLNEFNDEEDTTLRLSDLFSQLGPGKK